MFQPVSGFKQALDHIPENQALSHAVFLTSNEGDKQTTITTLKQKPLAGNTVLATSAFFALDVVAARGEDHGQVIDFLVVIDTGIEVAKLWKKTEELIHQFSQVNEAYTEIKTFLEEKADELWPNCSCSEKSCTSLSRATTWINELDADIGKGSSWLSTQKGFDKIKTIFAKNHYVFKQIDFFDTKNIRLLSQTMNKLGLTLDSTYLSNLREYAETKKVLPDFHESLRELQQLMTDQTLMIDTLPRILCHNACKPLKQRVISKMVSSDLNIIFPPSPPCHTPPNHTYPLNYPPTNYYYLSPEQWETINSSINSGVPIFLTPAQFINGTLNISVLGNSSGTRK